MTYYYAYKTSDGRRHEASIDAPSREAAFTTLRTNGIRPIKVVAADGSKANGEIVVPRAAWFIPRAIAVAIVVAVLVGGAAYLLGQRRPQQEPEVGGPSPNIPRQRLVIESLRLDPETRRELQRLEAEKQRAESAYREKMIERVNKGSLSRETANKIFRAMSLPEIP